MVINNFIAKYTIAFFTTLFLIVYVLKIPQNLTGQIQLVREYYYKNFVKSTVLDYILCLIYLLVGIYFINLSKNTNIIRNIVTIFITSCIISTGFYLYFNNTKPTQAFFSRWMRRAGFSAVIYDGIYLSIIYFIYRYLTHELNH